MKCNVCSTEVGGDQKYVVYLTTKGQITLCTSCVMKSIRKGSGSIMTRQGVIPKPRLAFIGNREACQIAEEEGWNTSRDQNYVAESGERVIIEHWYKAEHGYWFMATGEWVKDVGLSTHARFRRSCRNIRNYYAVWLVGA